MSATTLNLNIAAIDSKAENKLATVDSKLQKIDQQKAQLEAERQQILSEAARKQEAERLEKIKAVATEERRLITVVEGDYRTIEGRLKSAITEVENLSTQIKEAHEACRSIREQARTKLANEGASREEIDREIGRIEPLRRKFALVRHHNSNPINWHTIIAGSLSGHGLQYCENGLKNVEDAEALICLVTRGKGI